MVLLASECNDQDWNLIVVLIKVVKLYLRTSIAYVYIQKQNGRQLNVDFGNLVYNS